MTASTNFFVDSSPSIQEQRYIPNFDRSVLNKNALKVINKLRSAGFEAYFVGGCIRDLLTGYTPKDFDIATNAHPEEIAGIFRNCRLVGRRFRLAHIIYKNEIIEVATFKTRNSAAEMDLAEGTYVHFDNVYGNLQDDVFRRDFTINALYYCPHENIIRDFVGGMEDLRAGKVRLIGDAKTRYCEDPVRMLRALRFCAKLDFQMDEKTVDNIRPCQSLLRQIPSARLFDEMQKFFMTGHAEKSFAILCRYALLAELFPQVAHILRQNDKTSAYTLYLIETAMRHTDERLRQNRPSNIGFLLAVLFWSSYQQEYFTLLARGQHWHTAMHQAGDEVIIRALARLSIPLRFRSFMREVWTLQARFELAKSPKKMYSFLTHPRFRAAYDFLLLRNQCGEPLEELCDYWAQAQENMLPQVEMQAQKRSNGLQTRQWRKKSR